MSVLRLFNQHVKSISFNPYHLNGSFLRCFSSSSTTDTPPVLPHSLPAEEALSPRMQEFKKKLAEIPPVEMQVNEYSDHEVMEPVKPWPEHTNPHTGEVGGPRGLEPTRYGEEWEKNGQTIDF